MNCFNQACITLLILYFIERKIYLHFQKETARLFEGSEGRWQNLFICAFLVQWQSKYSIYYAKIKDCQVVMAGVKSRSVLNLFQNCIPTPSDGLWSSMNKCSKEKVEKSVRALQDLIVDLKFLYATLRQDLTLLIDSSCEQCSNGKMKSDDFRSS